MQTTKIIVTKLRRSVCICKFSIQRMECTIDQCFCARINSYRIGNGDKSSVKQSNGITIK